MFTRNGNTEVFASKVQGSNVHFVQSARRDYRPAQRHYGFRFDTVKTFRNRTVAEKVMLNMRTDGRKVRLLSK